MKILLLLLCLSFTSISQTPVVDSELPSGWEHEAENFASPITTSAWRYLLGATALSYAVFKLEENEDRLGFQEGHQTAKKGWRQAGNIIGFGLLQVGYVGLLLPSVYDGDEESLHNIEIMVKSTLYTATTTFALKLAVRSERRNISEKYDSFPSGHASSAFAFATNVALRHDWKWSLIAAPLAVWISASRIAADAHYWHDTVIGAGLGTSFALGMYYLEKKSEKPYLLNLIPVDGGFGVGWNYSFF